jgi:hypothetical protein
VADKLEEMIGRAEGDLLHDNFIPRYSALADAEPRLIVVVGVWLLLGLPAAFTPLVFYGMLDVPDQSLTVKTLYWVMTGFVMLIGIAITWKVTRRYIEYRRSKKGQ